MDETRAILDELAATDPDDEPAVLATVVRVRGSAYRGPGARRLLRRDGSGLGLISGGCLEADLARRAWALTEGGRSSVIRYDSTDPDDAWAFGVGCRGVVDILLDRIDAPNLPRWVGFLRDRLDRFRPSALARVLAAGDPALARVGSFLAVDDAGAVEHDLDDEALAGRIAAKARGMLGPGASEQTGRFDDGVAVAFEVVEPPPTLLVCGAGPDALPVVRLARGLGWSVAVVVGRHRPAARARFAEADEVLSVADSARLLELAGRPRASAVVMSHDILDDARLLGLLLPSPVGYVGLLGPAHRAARVLERLGPVEPGDLAKLRSPVGLDLGGESPAEIALSILAEVRASLSGRPGSPLRDRPGPIHDRRPAWPSA